MSATVYPVHVDARLDTHLSRWLWLVKWLLAIPHFVVLAFLWVAFVMLTVVAFFGILFTGRYPHRIFDFNVGVLRWSWRVAYYAYGALATDQYPPFTINEVPDYPAHLTVDYPEHLSRGLVLVKWWLLAIPHYLIVGFLAGSGAYIAWDTTQGDGGGAEWTWGGGIIGLLAIIAAVYMMFTGRYPREIFDLLLGLNRWVIRVAAYAGLMTDQYPPFRLDMGGSEPTARVAVPAGGPPAPGAGAVSAGEVPPRSAGTAEAVATPAAGPVTPSASGPAVAAPGQPAGAVTPTRHEPWGAGRVIAVILAALVFLVGGGMVTAGATLGVAGASLRNDAGFLMSPTQTVTTASYAVTTEPVVIEGAWSDTVPEAMLGEVAVRTRAAGGEQLFVGVAPTADVDEYLAGVAHATVVRVDDVDGTPTPVYRENAGDAPAALPGDSDIWAASATGAGEQELRWTPTTGEWSVVVMNADGDDGVSADVAVGAELPSLGWIVLGLILAGVALLIVGVVVALLAIYAGRRKA